MNPRTAFSLLAILLPVSISIHEETSNDVASKFESLISMIPADGQSSFLVPATPDQFKNAATALSKRIPNSKLPADIQTLYQICGGQRWQTTYANQLFPNFALNPIDNAIRDYEEICLLYQRHGVPSESSEFPNTWYDYSLFPFGWAPGTGTVYCIDIRTDKIYSFNPDGGIQFKEYESVSDLLEESIRFRFNEYGG